MKILLASGSPRRRELLGRLGLDFEVVASGVSEDLSGVAPVDLVQILAERKARAVRADADRALVIGADTTIDLDGAELGKPDDPDDARRILRLLRGREHFVVTGVSVMDSGSGRIRTSAVSTVVRMRRYSESEIEAYIASGEPMDRAGAYAIQELGGRLVAGIEGCYFNVVGLPLCETVRLLRLFGVDAGVSEAVCRLQSGEPCPRLGGA